MSDHSNVVFATGSIISYLENREDDIVIGLLPLSFDYGLYQLLMTFRFGGTLVLERGFTYPAAVLKRIEDERVTGLPGVPTMFAVLLKMDLTAYDLSSLRYITNTAAALPPSHVLALLRRVSLGTALLDVRPDGDEAHALLAARSGRDATRLGGHRDSRHRGLAGGRSGQPAAEWEYGRTGDPRTSRDARLLGRSPPPPRRVTGPALSPASASAIPAIFSAPTPKGISISSPARTISSRVEARRWPRKRSKTSCTR